MSESEGLIDIDSDMVLCCGRVVNVFGSKCLEADRLQDSSSGVQVSARHGPRIPPGVLPANVDVSGLLTPVDWLFPAPGRVTATAVSPSRDRVRGTVFLLNYEDRMSG